jgi:transposase
MTETLPEQLADYLPRIEITLLPEDTACPCCRAAMTVIGTDTSERLVETR